MIECTYKTASGRCQFKVSGETTKAVFEQISAIGNLFEEPCCGVCGSTSIRPYVKTVDNYTFYELLCQSSECGATLKFGQRKDTKELFPRRKDDQGQPIGQNGWSIYRGSGQGENWS